MITRRTALKGMAAGLLGSVAAAGYIGKNTERLWSKAFYPDAPNVLEAADHNTAYDYHDASQGFGLARPKPEGGRYYVDPMDDPEYRGQQGQGGKYAYHRDLDDDRHQS